MANRRPLVTISGGVSELPSGDAVSASLIANVPAGNLAATDVQAAINELDTEKLAASAIGVTVQGYDADIPTVAASQSEMEAGSETALRSMSPLRVKQAIDALGGGGGGTPLWQLAGSFYASGSFTPSATGKYAIIVIGGGGSGGALYTTNAPRGATGGGAGGFAFAIRTLDSAVTYTVTVGAGGAAVTSSVAGTGAAGNAGGNSSISGSDITTITANGGGAGGFETTNATKDGASGGAASGGDVNNTGGGSGSVTGEGTKASGGGAVNIFGTAYSSGNCDGQAQTARYVLSGGAGVGAGSANVDASGNTYNASLPGGAGGAPSVAIVSASGGGGILTPNGSIITPLNLAVYGIPFGQSRITSAGTASSIISGEGCGGSCSGSNIQAQQGYPAMNFAGGGGCVTNAFFLNHGGIGGGGGGAAYSASATSGAGGGGCVLIFKVVA